MTEAGWLVLATAGALGAWLFGFVGETRAGFRAVGLIVLLANTLSFGWHLCGLLHP